ncbi:hypothetical protein KAR91_09435 [Candidatus Pacearchaeota archaeon]|nr:hypothetical protein [Candidatus Pacearchaeota archaeon]
MNDVFISDGLTRSRISPATENLQREIRELLRAIEEGEDVKHYNFEVQKIVLDGNGVGNGDKLSCKDVQLSTDGADVTVTIKDSADDTGDGDANGFLLPTITTGAPVIIRVDNVGRLRFYGTAGKIVYVLARK